MSVTCAAACVATEAARPIKIQCIALIASPRYVSFRRAPPELTPGSRTRLLDELTDFLWRCEDHGGAVALHTGTDCDRLSGKRPELARVRLEPQVELPDLLGFAVRWGDRWGVAAWGEGSDLSFGGRLAQIELLARHSGHSVPALPRLRSLAFGNGPQVRNHVLPVLGFLEPGKRHARAGEELFRFDEPRIERRLGPQHVGAFQRLRIARKSFGARRLLVPDLGEARARHVLPGRHRVAGRALPEYPRSAGWNARAVREPDEPSEQSGTTKNLSKYLHPILRMYSSGGRRPRLESKHEAA